MEWISRCDNGFSHNGIDYHANDSIYLVADNKDQIGLFDIAVIIAIQWPPKAPVPEVKLRHFSRYNDVVEAEVREEVSFLCVCVCVTVLWMLIGLNSAVSYSSTKYQPSSSHATKRKKPARVG